MKSLADTCLKIILKFSLPAVTKIYHRRTPTSPQPNNHQQKGSRSLVIVALDPVVDNLHMCALA